MSAFTFGAITADQASAYTAADSLNFETGPANRVAVAFLPDHIAVALDGRTMAFGMGIVGDGDLFAAGGGRLFVGAAANEVVDGGPAADGFYGGQGADSLDGGGGDDLLHGNQGADLLRGGEGSDVIYGGQGDDLILTGVASGETDWAHGNIGDDTINGVGSTVIYGGQGADRITGGSGSGHLNGNRGDDTLQGGGSADTLIGESGRDLLLGGGGDDVFVFEVGASAVSADGADIIGGWEPGDRIQLPTLGGYAEREPAPVPGDPYYGGGGPGAPYTFATGLAAAESAVAMDPSLKVVAVQVGADVVVYADTDAQPGLDLAVILTGASLGAIDAFNFG